MKGHELESLRNEAERIIGKKLVFSDGPADSTIMMIGEAPGRNEEIEGKPFVGSAGKTLNKALELAGLARSDVYITNTVLWRPPNNRKPLVGEVAACRHFLAKQIRIVQPKIICTLGNTPLEAFMEKTPITKVHGQIINAKIDGLAVKLLPTFHPAAILYNRSLQKLFEDDIRKLASAIA